MNWIKEIDLKLPPNFNFNTSLRNKNQNYQLIHFYNQNYTPKVLDDRLFNTVNHLLSSNNKRFKLNVCTFNVHSFKSINTNFTIHQNFEHILEMIDTYKIDVLTLQEVETYSTEDAAGNYPLGVGDDNEVTLSRRYIIDKMKEHELLYNVTVRANNINANEFFGLMVFSRYRLDDIQVRNLPNQFRKRRLVISFYLNTKDRRTNNLKFCATHLEVGTKYNIYKNNKNAEERRIVNSQNRVNQLKFILNELDPDILLGDLNFAKGDPEFEFLNKYHTTINKAYNYTTPFGTIVDYIFYHRQIFKKLNILINSTIKTNISDHLPIFNMIEVK